MVTIKDVAQHANVSVATASRALRNIGYLRKDTYDRVLRASDELGYIANYTAQQLKSENTKTVGIIIADIGNRYYFDVLSALQKKLNEQNINIIIKFSSENPVDEEEGFRFMIGSRVSAILFTPTSLQSENIIHLAQKNGIKVIQLFRDVFPNLDAIINDDKMGCYLATTNLIKKGYKKLLLVDVGYTYLDFNQVKPSRSAGFTQAIQESATPIEHKIIHVNLGGNDLSSINKAIDEYQPDAIVTATNRMGLRALSHLKEHSMNAEVISFDDNSWLDYCEVSAVKQDMSVLIDCIYEFLMSSVKHGIRKSIIPQTLITRK